MQKIASAAGASPQTPLEDLAMLSADSLVGWEGDTPSSNRTPLKNEDGTYRYASDYGLKYTENAFAAGASPGPHLGSSRRSPNLLVV